jgi:fibronectin-binding autotransporter adhesin
MNARLAIRIRMVTILFVVTSVGGLRLQAQTAVHWTGSSSGNWNTASDWSGGVVPNNGGAKTYNVTISPGTAQTVTLNLGVTVTDLTLGSASGGASATLQSVASDSLTIAAGGNLTVASTGTVLFNTTGSDITIGSGGKLINNGNFGLEAAGETLSVTGTTTNAAGATLSIEAGSAATFSGNVSNSGTFETGFSGGNNTVTVTGTFTNASGATLALDGSGDVVNINALSNLGTLTLDAGSKLTITGGGNGVTDVAAGTTYTIGGTFSVKNGSTTTGALAKLNTIEGSLNLQNGQTNTITPTSGTLKIASGGQLNLSNAAASTTTVSITGSVSNSGEVTTGFSGGANTVSVSGTFTNATSASELILYSTTDAVNVNALSNSGFIQIGTTPGSGATLTITGGGQGVTNVVAGSSIELFGSLKVKNGSTTTSALANLTSVEGALDLENNQTTSVTSSGGTLTIASAGMVELSGTAPSTAALSITGNVNSSGAFDTGFAGGTNTVTVSGTFTNNLGGVLEVYAGSGSGGTGTDLVKIATLSNAGTVILAGAGSTLDITGTGTLTNSGIFDLTQGVLKFNSSTATLTGGGTVTLGNSTGTETGVVEVGSSDTGTLTNANNTITGYGNLGKGTLTLVNKGTINANGQVSSGGLTVQPGSGGLTNTGTLEATNQGTLTLEGKITNTGGTIEALGENGGTSSATVKLVAGTTVTGGTLTTTTIGSNSGIIEGTGAVTLSGVTNSGKYAVSAGTTTTLAGTVANSGSITLSGSTLSMGNSVTLNGAGTVVLSNSAGNLITSATAGLTLTTANVIEGSGTIAKLGIVNTGTIAADQSTPLLILPSAAGLNNKGTLSVSAGDSMKIGTSAGGALLNFSGTTLTGGTYNISGTLQFGVSGTNVVTDAANIALTGTGAKIIDFGGLNVLKDMATITSAGSFTLSSGAAFATAGNFTNNGQLTVNASSQFSVAGSLSNFSSSTKTLTGGTYTAGGKLNFAGANIVTDAANITLNGTGEIVNSTNGSNGLANLATITAAGSFALGDKANFTTVGNLTANGKLTVSSGSALTIAGTLTNFNKSTDTLAGGTYTVGGTMEFTGANIVNNAANLTISGNAAKILNGTTNGLANFANNTGTLIVTGNGSFTTGSATFTNSGKVAVAQGSTLTVGGGNAYNQSAGTTTVDGTLSGFSTGIKVTGGTILGAGNLNSSVTVGGSGTAPTISAGDSGKAGLLTITGNYTQLSSATMSSFIGGTTGGTQYSQLQASGTANLAGTLTVALASGFHPTVGSSFTVLTAESVTGTFSNSTIAINGSEHFNVSYTSTGVVLTVASGAAQSGGLAQSSHAAAAVTTRQSVLTGGLRRSIGRMPRVGRTILVARTANTRARSGAIPPVRFGLSRFEKASRLPAQLAAWDAPSGAPPATRFASRLEHVRRSVPRSSNWTESVRSASSLRTPATEMFTRRTPVKLLPPLLPRLGR